jgi:hypothetical protein
MEEARLEQINAARSLTGRSQTEYTLEQQRLQSPGAVCTALAALKQAELEELRLVGFEEVEVGASQNTTIYPVARWYKIILCTSSAAGSCVLTCVACLRTHQAQRHEQTQARLLSLGKNQRQKAQAMQTIARAEEEQVLQRNRAMLQRARLEAARKLARGPQVCHREQEQLHMRRM